jgi:hypothetical protein
MDKLAVDFPYSQVSVIHCGRYTEKKNLAEGGSPFPRMDRSSNNECICIPPEHCDLRDHHPQGSGVGVQVRIFELRSATCFTFDRPVLKDLPENINAVSGFK